MVQCETCDVWQHGLCVGYEDEGQVANIDYYCEECRPDLHHNLLKYALRFHFLFHDTYQLCATDK